MSRLLITAVVALLLGLTTGCGTDEGYTSIQIPSGFIRTINTVPDSPPLIVEIGTQSAQQLNFTQSTAFVASLPDLTLDMDVRYAGVNTDIFLFDDEPLFVNQNTQLTVLLAGSLESPSVIRVRNEPTDGIDAATETEIQFVNAATRLDTAVTFRLLQDGAVLSEAVLTFGQSSALIRTDAGEYRVEALAADGSLLWDSGTFTAQAGFRPLVMLADYFGPGNSLVRGLRVTPDGTVPFANEPLPSALRVANMDPTQQAINVSLRGADFESAVSFQSVTDFVEVPAGTASIRVTPADEPDTVLFEGDSFALRAGTYLTLLTSGAGDTSTGTLFINDRRPVPTRAKVEFVNVAPTGGRMDFYMIDSGTSIDNQNPLLRLPVAPEAGALTPLTLLDGNYDFSATSVGTKDRLAGANGLALPPGGLYSLYVTDAPGGGEPLQVVQGDDLSP